MIGTSRYSKPPIYIASIAIHTTGIVLLFQYLLMRNACSRCARGDSTNTLRPETPYTNQLPNQLRRSVSTVSHEFTRKRRRPYTTYGGGGDYLQREGSGSSWESIQKSVDRTASGRRIPARSLNAESRPRTSDSRPRTAESRPKTGDRSKDRDLRRPRSFGGTEKSTPIPRQDSGKSSSSRSSTENEDSNEKVPTSPKRQPSVGKLRRRSDRLPSPGDESKPGLEEAVNSSPEDSVSFVGEVQELMLRPVLLPPLTNPRRTRSFRRNVSDDSNISAAIPPSTSLQSPAQQHDSSSPSPNSLPSTSSDFVFPFRSDPPSQVAESADDFSHQQPNTALPALSDHDLDPHPTWPLQLEDLLEPDPPFASEERRYVSPTPSESRLSTITEEGTVRESVVATPPNVVVTDGSSCRTKSNSTPSMRTATPMSPTLAAWYSQGGAPDNVNAAMNQPSGAASPEGSDSKT